MGTCSDGHLFLFNKGGTVWTCLKRIHIGTNGKNVQDDLIKLLKTLKDDEKYITEGLELGCQNECMSEANVMNSHYNDHNGHHNDHSIETHSGHYNEQDSHTCRSKSSPAGTPKDLHSHLYTFYTVIRCDPAGGYLSEDTLIYIEEDIRPLKSIHLLWDVHSDFSNYAAIFTPSNSNMTKESIVDKVYGPFFVKNTRPGLQDDVADKRDNRTRAKNCNLRILSLVLERPDDECASDQRSLDQREQWQALPEEGELVTERPEGPPGEGPELGNSFRSSPFHPPYVGYSPDPLSDSSGHSFSDASEREPYASDKESLIDERYLSLKRSVLADISEIRQNVMCNMQQEDPFLYENAFFRDSAFLFDDLQGADVFGYRCSGECPGGGMDDQNDAHNGSLWNAHYAHYGLPGRMNERSGMESTGSLRSLSFLHASHSGRHSAAIHSFMYPPIHQLDGVGAKLFTSMFKNYISNQLASEFRIFYFGKSFYIGDLKFFVSNLEPANKPGYISQKTRIYFHVDSVQEYSKVTVAPLVDTLPTLYQYDLKKDYVKPFFRLNNHRIFHKGDVFKYSGIEFRIQQVTSTGSIFDVLKRAKCGRVGTDTEIVIDDPVRPRVLDLLSPQKVAILRETPPCYRESLFARFTSELDHESLLRLHNVDSCPPRYSTHSSLLNACTPSNHSDIHYTLKCTVCYEPIYTKGSPMLLHGMGGSMDHNDHHNDHNDHHSSLRESNDPGGAPKECLDTKEDEVTPSTVAETPSALFEPVNIKRLPCGHIFHKGCVYTWALNKNSCPNCRLEIDGTEKGAPAPLVYNLSDEDSDSYGTTNCNSLSDMEEYFKSLEMYG